jgi:MoaA/NifB/PqqE/SkfB family radical SAM enzyme
MKFSSSKALSVVKRSVTPNRPYHAQWLLTRRCNYRCRGCNVWREKKPSQGEEVSTDYVKKGLDVLHKLGTIEIVLSGGNPLLRDDIDEIINYASRFFITTIYDNGSMAVKKIDALNKADFVAISVDSLDEKKFDYIRGVNGAWKTAMNAIETLKQEGIHVGVSPTISQLNLSEILDFTRYFTDRDIPVWYCLYGYDYPSENQLFGIGKKADEFEIKDKETMVKMCEGLAELKKQRSGIYITNKTLTALQTLFSSGQRTWKCKALKSFFMIDSLGRVAGCHRNEPVASILELPTVWDNPRLEDLRRKYSECSQCTYLCYVFYSLHGNVRSNIGVVWDQWRNVKTLLRRD